MQASSRPEVLHYVERFLEAWPLKLAASILIWLYGPWQEGYGVLIALIGLDTATGVWASRREGRTIRSSILRVKALSKIGFYAAALLVASLTDRALQGTNLLGTALVFAIVSEALSTVENLARIFPDHPLTGALRGVLEARSGKPKDRPGP